MKKPEIKQIGAYLNDLEEGLVEWDYDQLAMQTEYPILHQTIKRLMDATFETDDQELKPVLAMMEMKARKCLDCIKRRLHVRN
jgi:hypothetical protein